MAMSYKLCVFVFLFVGTHGFLYTTSRNRDRDCIITPWTKFRSCKLAANGTYLATRRRFISDAVNGGKPCPAGIVLTEQKECSEGNALAYILRSSLGTPSRDTTSSGYVSVTGYGDLEKVDPSLCSILVDGNGTVIASGSCNSNVSAAALATTTASLQVVKKSSFNHFKRDILFLIDVESLTVNNTYRHRIAKSAVASLLTTFCGRMEIHPRVTRLAIAVYANGKIIHHFDLNNNYTSPAKAMKAVNSIRPGQLLQTPTNITLMTLEEVITKVSMTSFQSNKGARVQDPLVQQTIVLITDRNDDSNCTDYGNLLTAKKHLVANEVDIFTLSVGSTRRQNSCKKQFLDLDTGKSCLQQFYFRNWRQLKHDFDKYLRSQKCYAYDLLKLGINC